MTDKYKSSMAELAEVVGPTAPQLEVALRYLWDAWAEAEGDGQPRGWVFGPELAMKLYLREVGETWREAPAEIQETIRRVIGLKT
jgi:hypothetical protein